MNRQKISMVGALVCVLGLGFSDTAKGQITTTPPLATGMSFQVQSGGASSTQTLLVNTAGGATTLVVTVPSNQSWLSINGNTQATTFYPSSPASLQVTVNTTGLPTGLTVSANVSIAIYGQPSTAIQYPIALTVGTPSILSANPATLSFSGIQNSSAGSPSSTPITITSSGAQLTYNVSATTQSGANWILLSSTFGIQTGNTPGFSVSVNPFGLAVGNYNGTVLVQSTTTGDSVTIPVSLSVTQGSTLSVTGTLNNFIYQAGSGPGGFSPQTQTLMISTNSGSLNYSVTLTNPTGPSATTSWLLPSSTGGLATATPQTLSLSLSSSAALSALPQGTYTITVSIAPTGAGSSANATNVVATLVVSNNAILNTNTRSLTFTAPLGSTSNPSQTITVTSSNGSPIPYQVTSNQLWLSVLPASGTTALNPTFQVFVNPAAANLAASTTPYTGTLNVIPTNGDNYSVPISVSLTVTGLTSQILAGPGQLLFSYQTTKTAPGVQLVQLTSPSSLGFTVTTTTAPASNCPTANWLTANASQFTASNVNPATLTVSVAVAGMTSGFCTGQVVVTYNNGSNANSTVIIPVTVDVAATALLTVSQPVGFGVVTGTFGTTTVIGSQISINSTDGSALGFSATASTPGAPVSWLYLASSSGTTQQYLQVQISPNGLPVGTYTGNITIFASNNANLPSGALTIPVTLTVSANTTVAVTPASLTFTQSQGAATPPAAQTITMTATGGSTTFTAAIQPVTGGSWLQITPSSGTASGTISASVLQNTLSVGTYTSNITLTFQNSATPTVTVPVTLTISPAQTVTVAPTSLTFSYQLGSAAPATQTLKVTSTGGSVAIQAGSVSTNPSGWLSVTPASGSTGTDTNGLTLTVSVAPSAFTQAGTYNGTITITPTGQSVINVPVTVTVTGVPIPQPVTISNSASGTFGSISPGELITIKGANLGPATGTSFTVGTGNTVSSTLSGVQVLFDTIPGTPTYVSATQINVIVPYEIAGRTTTNVSVSYQGSQSAVISQLVASQAPGIYTFTANGSGQAAVVNQNGTLNGPASGIVLSGQNVATSPAPQGSVIAVYMTGGGQTNPISTTGTVTPTDTLYKIPSLVKATINGVDAPVQFAGNAPSLVTGVVQVNLTVPAGVSGTGLPLVITINGVVSASGPTVTVQ